MRAWRICRRRHITLDGEGARLYGGRWNSRGVAVVYASSTLALAALEYLVHLDIENAPSDLVAMSIGIPSDAPVLTIAPQDLAKDWSRYPAHPGCTAVGDAWVAEGTALVLEVPSAVVPEESNILLNPRHARGEELTVDSLRPFSFDPRLQ